MKMKLSVLCLCLLLLLLALVSGGLLTRNDLQSDGIRLNKISRRAGLHKIMLARRGHYEQQRLHMMRPKGMPDPLRDYLPTKASPDPGRPDCSQLGQSCLPQQGCCETSSTCHCHFFQAICFCRRRNVVCSPNS
ncbi:agouti-related protein-like [Nerophis ophidion]|uniref:agouti-related protein-like n=1 Tax=Nerophis ophidion TaxID=159077 RepID=UPI002ADF88DF|nr:agouti-related protein-like [Nerophis ophidion]